jgi:hypothetical protein
MFKIFFLALWCLFLPLVSQAQDVGFVVGIRADSADTEVTGAQVSGQNSVHFGAILKTELTETLGLRLGMLYVPRQYEYQVNQNSSSEVYKFTYFELPVGILYRFSEAGGVFIGPTFGFGLDKSCASNPCQGVSNSLTTMQVGASFKFAPQFGVEIFYETGMSNITSQLKQQRAVGANLMVTFE